jgi:PhnB protein
MKKKTSRPKKKVGFIPKGYHTVTPYLACGDAASAIEFYKKAFGATEVFRMPAPGGRIGHAEVKIGDSRIMLTDEYAEMSFVGPPSRGGTTVHIHLYAKDVDAMVERAVAAGAKLLREVKDQFYGDRRSAPKPP